MQLTCANCGNIVPANKINIQKMLAVCPHCDAIFAFESPDQQAEQQKDKRRKIKKPPHVIQRDDGKMLTLAFRTNFRLDRDENLQGLLFMVGSFSFITIMLGVRAALLVASGFAIFTLLMMYVLALRLYNRTQITMDDDYIRVSRSPLYNPFQHINQLNLHDVTSIHYEETAISKKEQYDTPRFRVYAITQTGKERLIINDVIEDYAVYIAQQLDEYLHDAPAFDSATSIDENLAEYDTSRLITDADSHDTHNPDAHLPSLGSLTQSTDKS